MTPHKIVPATPALLEAVLENLRKDTESETIGFDKALIIREAFERSRVFVGLANGRVPACVYGVRERGTLEPAELWLGATPLIEKYKSAFLRGSKVFVEWAVREYGTVGGIVKVENVRSQRWLRWLGFELKEEAEHSLLGRVYPFERRLY